MTLISKKVFSGSEGCCFDYRYSLSCMADKSNTLETDVSVLFTNTCTSGLYNEREIFSTVRGEAKCSIENFEFIVQSVSACICKQITNLKSLTHLIYNLSSLLACKYCTPFVNKTKQNKIK